MNNDIGNTLLKHCGEPDMPAPVVRAILTDAVCVGELTLENEALKQQNAAFQRRRGQDPARARS